MSRYREPQLQVTENVCDLCYLGPNIYQCFKIEGIYTFNNWLYRWLYKGRMSTVVDISVLRDEMDLAM